MVIHFLFFFLPSAQISLSFQIATFCLWEKNWISPESPICNPFFNSEINPSCCPHSTERKWATLPRPFGLGHPPVLLTNPNRKLNLICALGYSTPILLHNPLAIEAVFRNV
jgi:hypothetical protein